LTCHIVGITVAIMETTDFDQLYSAYKQAVDQWVEAIRAEEALATGDHSMTQMEAWDEAGFRLHDAELTAKKARDAYKNALRKKNYGF
jgi:TRAP-type C4-dicarboxylate transport system substrate-binding protein